MIFAEWKPLTEIVGSIHDYDKILLVGCAACVAECATGGEKEVETLAPLLRLALKEQGRDVEIQTATLEKQCEWEFVEELAETAAQVDAVLSLACGIGAFATLPMYFTIVAVTYREVFGESQAPPAPPAKEISPPDAGGPEPPPAPDAPDAPEVPDTGETPDDPAEPEEDKS